VKVGIEKNMKKKIFIALEGIDGSGKSTQSKILAERFVKEGYTVFSTFEPSNGKVGILLRNILKGDIKADERTIAGLFVADRLDHLLNQENGIVKKLEEGHLVITDRYYFSSYAYNGTHINMDWVINANSLSADILRPNLNIFIDLDPELSLERLRKNRESLEIYETLENLKAVRAKYFEAFDLLKDKENVVIVDGNQSLEQISDDIWETVRSSCLKSI